MRVIIVGAGVFGASLAWTLAGRGAEVVLVDQFEPGDRRATSGGETRLIRSGHGAETDYTEMARRAWTLWRELERETGTDLLTETGVCWFAGAGGDWVSESEASLRRLGIPAERWSPDDAAKRFPSLRTGDLEWVLHEPEAGVLQAQKAVRTLAAEAQARGAQLVRGRAQPHGDAVLVNGAAREGDHVVWSCGGWLASLFADVVQVRVALQELFFFAGAPAWRNVPGWIDPAHNMYGTPDLHGLGVKVACDDTGPPLDPDADLPPASEAGERLARRYLAERFPALADVPLAGSTTCRYELSADTHFIVAPHPDHASVWLVGGGSGRGFKHGPALAERIAAAWLQDAPLPPHFALGGRSLRGAGWRF
jgi:glycine/D-amino acid oxidase-like deaminating enzyme